ncbi:MAG: restriction endonuclease subunit S [Ardenticatenales bacterium]|nr:restriction endonuclease subunit S [Ardenticatenales bacterium]
MSFQATSKSVPQLRFSEFNYEWEGKLLGKIAKLSKGKGISKADIELDGKHPCIRYGELYTSYGTVIDNILSFTNVEHADLILSEGGEVIIPSSGETALDIATASVVKLAGIALGGDLNIIKANVEGDFLAYYLIYKKRIPIARLAQGISVIHLYSSQLSKLKLHIPKIEEQRKIAAFLGAVEEKLGALRRKRNCWRYKRG